MIVQRKEVEKNRQWCYLVSVKDNWCHEIKKAQQKKTRILRHEFT
jgi:hypothetical protein